ncbi:YjgB family protein [Clostridium oryzae]|uniref:DUF4309 domain-containing protein n=1 Tax=Clostridium oryzae TaxID=1450648 RepID=A0A1V4IVA6_9CLOT|nr:YjgB family protein [Clostridium oryzae]OPJ63833.1 hypothetical protein CLORY_10170 [Clostridium oryzae]
MTTFLNKKLITCGIAVLCFTLLSGCSNGKKTPKVNKSSNEVQTDYNKKSSSNETNTSKEKADKKTPSANKEITKSHSKVSNQNNKYNSQKALLTNIMKLAKSGKVINCNFSAKFTNMASVEEKWGKADTSEWVSKAKGTYATYAKHNIVLGFNKGEQIFEVRSFDKKLNTITLNGIKKYYGKPAHDVNPNGEKIIGYVISKNFKILFVFPKNKNGDAVLNHYSILYPQGTVNYMSGDLGRQW